MIGRRRLAVNGTKQVAVVTSTIPITVHTPHRDLIQQIKSRGLRRLCDFIARSRTSESWRGDGHPRSIAGDGEICPLANLSVLAQWLWARLTERPSLMISTTPRASSLCQLAGKVTPVTRRLYYLGGLRPEGEQGTSLRRSVCLSPLNAESPHV